jgi:uncharacterized membrane protein YdjX (TVP38/TMEM64 family)
VQKLLRPLILLTLILLIPIIPFVLFGPQVESWVSHRVNQSTTALTTGLLIVGLLSTDIVLPIPSSMVSTFGGARLGWVTGTGVSWLGMTLGASLGFFLARRWGRPFALRFTRKADLDRLQQPIENWGAVFLVVTRALPVVAEATVLLLGLHRLSWNRFLPPVLLSNLGIALAYSAFGDWAQHHAWLPFALAISVALPLLLAGLMRKVLSSRPEHPL